ncbi:MAG: Gfo/Idh/MocA family oxidoreductase [candidate division Zixibacteria bacterium]|nr:Gfo/Idh/MocA family oxidoreductase [Candidatus Tariuqbacter arcticus]
MNKTRIGIIGTGGITQVKHLPFLSNYDEAEVVAICDIDRNKAGAVAQKFKVPHFFRQAEDILARDDIDAVFVCTPTNSHMSMTLAALEAGKHVFVEKPIARTSAEAQRMVDAAESTGRLLMTAMYHRFRPDSLVLKNFIDEEKLGEVFMIRSGWMKRSSGAERPEWMLDPRFSGGGVMMDLGIPMLDLCLWFLNFPEILSVDARTFNRIIKSEVEDEAALFLKLRDGRLITVDVGWSIPAQNTIAFTVIHGEKGTAWLNPLRINRELHGQLMELSPGKQYTPIELYHRSFENTVRHFIESVRNGRQPISSGQMSLDVMEIVEMIYRSAKEKREIGAKGSGAETDTE